VYRFPIYASPVDKKIYEHEVGFDYGGSLPFAETGPILLGNGDSVMNITQMIPDEKIQGEVTATFKTRFYPNDTERSYGPYDMSNPTSLRVTGRQLRFRVDGVNGSDWRVGVTRLETKAGGKR
jgi:hypothetical protein